MKLTLNALEFGLVAGLTAAILFAAAQLLLRLRAWARKRGQAAEALPAEAGRDARGSHP